MMHLMLFCSNKLGTNELNGSIPSEMGSMTSLESLWLSKWLIQVLLHCHFLLFLQFPHNCLLFVWYFIGNHQTIMSLPVPFLVRLEIWTHLYISVWVSDWTKYYCVAFCYLSVLSHLWYFLYFAVEYIRLQSNHRFHSKRDWIFDFTRRALAWWVIESTNIPFPFNTILVLLSHHVKNTFSLYLITKYTSNVLDGNKLSGSIPSETGLLTLITDLRFSK